ncbi:MAG TPA: response regulator transcription factor [Candidatus Polarisedimenticolia bacterium]|nr:response regulator transcription factor [Candidatus Polarisedimenticolia bacterium]
MPRVLIVEDDESMAIALRDGFEYEGFAPALARDGEAGLRQALAEPPDLIILDVMLPRMSGLDVCRKLRADGVATPIIMLTARGQEIDKVLGLKMGADDYVTKPFSFMELMARAEAVMRRANGGAGAAALEAYSFGDVSVNFKKHEARKGGRPVDLSQRELQLLKYLIEHRGQVVAREQLLYAVWGYEQIPFTRTVDMHVAKLRKKIEGKADEPQFIVTVHRVGYKFIG